MRLPLAVATAWRQPQVKNDLIGVMLINGEEAMILVEALHTVELDPANFLLVNKGSRPRKAVTVEADTGNMLLKYECPSLLEKL